MMQAIIVSILILQVAAERTTYDDIAKLKYGEACPKGSTSLDGTHAKDNPCEPCYEGEYSNVEGGDLCEYCSAGTYAPDVGYWECIKCPKGQINTKEGGLSCRECPAGQFSPYEGGTTCQNCPAGSFQNAAGKGECDKCAVGFYQESQAKTSCDACPLGSSSPEGSTSPAACEPCAMGHYAPEHECLPCPVKTYNDVTGAVECKECPSNLDKTGATTCEISCKAGEISVDDECVPCPAGTKEEDGKCVECPVGHYSANPGSVKCDACKAGSFASKVKSVECAACSPGSYADNEGSATCTVSPAGYYVTEAGSTNPTACPPGAYCPEGSLIPFLCPVGTFGDIPKATATTDCKPCTAGSYCAQAGITAPTGNCEAGYYCPSGAKSPQEKACPAGSYCPEGSSTPTPCQKGAYNDLQLATECKVCPAGQYCSEAGLVDPSGPCHEGYYCEEGSVTGNENVCPSGQYCPLGSVKPMPCPIGTFSSVTGLSSLAECRLCSPGKYCSAAGLTEPEGDCFAGYYCPGGSKSAKETVCPRGSYCPPASPSPVQCPEGTATVDEGATSASDCLVTDCEPGWYKNNGACKICPKGTFSNIKNAVACRKCPQNQYNSEEGSDQCMKCPDTAFTWNSATSSFDGCIGPIIEVCSQPELKGTCHKYYDDNLSLNMTVKSLKVIRGEFDIYERSHHGGRNYKTLAEGFVANTIKDTGLSVVASFGAVINDIFCYLERGNRFRGSVRSTSRSGKACLNWKDTPMASKAKDNNHCQNPDPAHYAKPFCYVSPKETEECDIPACVWDTDCYSGIGVNYRGSKTTTDHGKDCQNWYSDFPHPHTDYDSDEWAWAGIGDHSKCRNPSKDGRPWCYTTNLFMRWDYCDIPRCSREDFPYFKFA